METNSATANIELCLVCSEEKTLLCIDESFKSLLKIMLGDDSDIPQAICQDCKKMVELMHQFGKRNKRSSDIMQAFINGKLYSEDTEPESSTTSKDRERKEENQAAKRRRTSIDSHVEVVKPQIKNEMAVSRPVDSTSNRKKEDRRKIEPKRKNSHKDYKKSDEFLFGCSDLELEDKETTKIITANKITPNNYKKSYEFLFGCSDSEDDEQPCSWWSLV